MIILPNKSKSVWPVFLKANKSLVFRYAMGRVEYGIANNLNRVELFKFENDSMMAFIQKEDYLSFLNGALDHFVSQEEYEYANHAKLTIEQYHIKKLIKESMELTQS
jgi:hypothetical protein